ncbi:Tetratricopeptide repeat, partial [Trinorchestia longiramus]
MTKDKSIVKDASEESIASLDDSSLLDRSKEITSSVPDDSSGGADLDLPTGIEEVEVQGEMEETAHEWMDIIGSGDLKKKILVPGIVETRPARGDTVCIELTVRLSDGSLVEDTHTLYFTLGDSEVIPGLDLVVPLMDRGELCDVYIHSRFAYGSKGDEDRVPPDASLLCTVKLLDFKPEDSPESLSLEDRQQIGNRKRIRGNWWFNRGDYSEAVQCYKAAVDFLDDTEEVNFDEDTKSEVLLILGERLKALNNMAAAQIKLGAFDAALASVDVVLRCQPDNVKALFRKGKALHMKGSTIEAVKSLKQALQLEPENRTIHAELSKMSEAARLQAESEKSLYRRMLGLTPDQKKEPDRHITIRM